MLRPTAVKVIPKDDYMLEITYDNNEVRIFDVKPYIKGEFYGKLSEKPYFCAVRTDGFTVVWPDGQDICPDDVYYKAVSV